MRTFIDDIAASMSDNALLRLSRLIMGLALCLVWFGNARADAASTPPAWDDLLLRLQNDGLYNETVARGISLLPEPSPDPMGRKIKELYTSRFVRPFLPPETAKPRLYLYPNVVTGENAAACRAFLDKNRAAFAKMEKDYGVPRDIAVALLFVETRLGSAAGKHNVFYTLASMAACRSPEQLRSWLGEFDLRDGRTEWLRETMLSRSNWAYRELAAFIRYAEKNGVDLFSVYGSMYGAFGICQFMPSSVAPYAADGNNDGKIDLFALEDALASLASYLTKNGWKPGLSRAARHAALRKYNRVDIYANTILALADTVRGDPVGKPVVTVGKRNAGQKAKIAKEGIR
jgi:membrane-bound lytic murein transglycosylase B